MQSIYVGSYDTKTQLDQALNFAQSTTHCSMEIPIHARRKNLHIFFEAPMGLRNDLRIPIAP